MQTLYQVLAVGLAEGLEGHQRQLAVGGEEEARGLLGQRLGQRRPDTLAQLAVAVVIDRSSLGVGAPGVDGAVDGFGLAQGDQADLGLGLLAGLAPQQHGQVVIGTPALVPVLDLEVAAAVADQLDEGGAGCQLCGQFLGSGLLGAAQLGVAPDTLGQVTLQVVLFLLQLLAQFAVALGRQGARPLQEQVGQVPA